MGKEEIISKIAEIREKQGLSETELAKMVGVQQNKVWRLLNGKTKRIDYDLVEKLQNALGIAEPPSDVYSAYSLETIMMAELMEEKMKSMTPEEKQEYVKRLLQYARKG